MSLKIRNVSCVKEGRSSMKQVGLPEPVNIALIYVYILFYTFVFILPGPMRDLEAALSKVNVTRKIEGDSLLSRKSRISPMQAR